MEPTPLNEQRLHQLQCSTAEYFLDESNAANGLIADRNREGSPASIAAMGLALSCYCACVERGQMSRADAIQRTLQTLRFLRDSEQSQAADATGYKGFYYHFLDMKSGRRVWKSELSSIDTALLVAGVLSVAQYYNLDTPVEREIRETAETLYRRIDWRWMQNLDEATPGYEACTHGWKPPGHPRKSGFLRARWQGYNEGLILYALGLGAPEHPLTIESYASWLMTYKWKKVYDIEYLYCGPLFTHQLSHAWLDFRGIQDEYMREKGTDYFDNSRRATLVQQEYCKRNPRGFKGYSKWCWGITASDGPGKETRTINDRKVHFYDYQARGVPYGPDDGTLSPWSALASLPFAPEIVLPTLEHFEAKYPEMVNHFGFHCSFNPTYQCGGSNWRWVSPSFFGINQGTAVLMIENYRSGLFWRLMRTCPYIAKGLQRAGFSGGWLV